MHRILLKIDLDTIVENAKKIQKAVSPAKVMAVLKANAYGLGIKQIAKCLMMKTDINRLSITTAEEAQILRRECPNAIIYHLGCCFPEEIESLIQNNAIICTSDTKTVLQIVATAKKMKTKALLQLLFDTGMGRLGIPPGQYQEEWEKIATILTTEKKYIQLCAVYSHFSSAKETLYSKNQIEKFRKIKEMISQKIDGIDFHICNSDGIHCHKEQWSNIVRPGISFYDEYSSEEGLAGDGDKNHHGKEYGEDCTPKIETQMCYELSSKIVSVRRLPKGHGIGYDHVYHLKEDATIATIAAGYADGIPMQLTNKKAVIVKNKKVMIIGKISMDYTTVLISSDMQVSVGERVIFLGSQGNQKISIKDWAKWKKTNPHEVLTSLGKRVKRQYLYEK